LRRFARLSLSRMHLDGAMSRGSSLFSLEKSSDDRYKRRRSRRFAREDIILEMLGWEKVRIPDFGW